MQMFKVLGTDGKEYGPVDSEVLRQWIVQRRAGATTSVQAEGSNEWRPLSTFPEFAEALAANQPVPATLPPVGPIKTSRLAIASLVCGVLGFLCLPALAGLVLGIVALVKINKSQGQLRGQGLAIAGIVLSGFMMLIAIPVGAGLLLPALAKAKARAQQINSRNINQVVQDKDFSRLKDEAERTQCVNNLKQICLGARMYAADNHQDTFPPDFLSMSNELSTPRILVCAADQQHTKAASWAEFDSRKNLTCEYLKPGIKVDPAMNEIIFRCPIHKSIGLGDGSVQRDGKK